MFPAVVDCSPAALNRCATSAVVVVLPFVPVIAMLRVPGCNAASARKPRSSSEKIATPAWRAAASTGASGGAPRDTITPAAWRLLGRSWRPISPSTHGTPFGHSAAAPAKGGADAALAETRHP